MDRYELAVSKKVAADLLAQQIDAGRAIITADRVSGAVGFRHIRSQAQEWIAYTEQVVLRLFVASEPAEEFLLRGSERGDAAGGAPSFDQDIEAVRDEVTEKLTSLRGFALDVEFAPSSQEPALSVEIPPVSTDGKLQNGRRIFIVHGRDHGLKEAAARTVADLGYEPVILHEQANRGETIIAKFERESADADFAIVLLTPDDRGGLNEADAALYGRARQNVVFEFGYFVHSLGRGRVAALISDPGLEQPSDVSGVIYIAVSDISDENWRIALAKEMKAAGLDINLNNLF